jgi:hypothetical protein
MPNADTEALQAHKIMRAVMPGAHVLLILDKAGLAHHAQPLRSHPDGATEQSLGRLSVSISIVLLLVYLLFLTFQLLTHPALFAGSYVPEKGTAHLSMGRAASLLAGATVGIAWMSEILVAAIEPTAREFGLSNVFVGVFVVATPVPHTAGHSVAPRWPAEASEERFYSAHPPHLAGNAGASIVGVGETNSCPREPVSNPVATRKTCKYALGPPNKKHF